MFGENQAYTATNESLDLLNYSEIKNINQDTNTVLLSGLDLVVHYRLFDLF